MKRCCDVAVSAVTLALLAPVLIVVTLLVRLTSPGPAIIGLDRVGRAGAVFSMHKFRTMNVDHGMDARRLTHPRDPRITSLGLLLRRLKIDELPQLYDVLRGKMSLVGPRPEDPHYVAAYYRCRDLELLRVRPGLTSPATLFDFTHGESILAKGDPEQVYVEELLPAKLALDHYYLCAANPLYDLRIIGRTAVVMIAVASGKRWFSEPSELSKMHSAMSWEAVA